MGVGQAYGCVNVGGMRVRAGKVWTVEILQEEVRSRAPSCRPAESFSFRVWCTYEETSPSPYTRQQFPMARLVTCSVRFSEIHEGKICPEITNIWPDLSQLFTVVSSDLSSLNVVAGLPESSQASAV